MAISRRLSQVQALPKGLVLLCGNFTTSDGSGAIGTIEGTGFATTAVAPNVGSIELDAPGTYTFTLPGSGTVDILSMWFTLEEPTKDLKWQVLSRDDSARTVTLEIRTNGTEAVAPVDADLTSGGKVHFGFWVKNSSQ
jgi:VCBS repeat-containing protein